MKALDALWAFLGSALLSAWLMLGLVVVLCCGYHLFEAAPSVYEPLNRLLLWDWMTTHGWGHLANTWWFFAFLGLLGLLVANTLVCTIQKVVALARRGARESRLDFALRFSPHVMHLAFVIILASHLVTYVWGLNAQNNVVLLGREITIPESRIKVKLVDLQSEFYSGQRLPFYQGRALTQHIRLVLTDPDGTSTTKTLAYCGPVWHQGYSIHLKHYYPSAKTGMPRTPYANLIIRKDPGVATFFGGTAVFAVGLLAYLWQAIRQHRQRTIREA